jgi:hypothetical protein
MGYDILLTDIPQAVIDDAKRYTSYFIVGLVRLDISEGWNKPTLVGSGTLVRLGDHHGILAARHVLAKLQ